MSSAVEEITAQLAALSRFETNDPSADVENVRALPGHAGFSYSFELRYRKAAGAECREHLVLRIPPPGVRIAGPADVARQARIMASLAGTAVPVPPVRWYGDDPRWFGRPYSVVGLVEGQQASFERAADRQEALSECARNATAALAALHTIEWQSRQAAWGAPSPLASELERLDHLLNRPTLEAELVALAPRLRERLRSSLPPAPRIGCVHGDFQWSNCLFVGTKVAAVIDWELAQIGAVLLDLGWFCLFCDSESWVTETETLVARGAPWPEEIIALYQEASREVVAGAEVNWFRAFSGYRFGVISAFNLMLHRRGKRPDPAWEGIAKSVPRLFERGLELLG